MAMGDMPKRFGDQQFQRYARTPTHTQTDRNIPHPYQSGVISLEINERMSNKQRMSDARYMYHAHIT